MRDFIQSEVGPTRNFIKHIDSLQWHSPGVRTIDGVALNPKTEEAHNQKHSKIEKFQTRQIDGPETVSDSHSDNLWQYQLSYPRLKDLPMERKDVPWYHQNVELGSTSFTS